MQKPCEETASDNEFAEKKKEEIMAKKVIERKEKRRLFTAKNKVLKRTKKAKQEQYSKNELWNKLKKLNSSFAKMKEVKKQHKNKKLVLQIIYLYFFLLKGCSL